MGPAGSVTASPKAFNPGLVPKQERNTGTGSILNLNLGQQQQQRRLAHNNHLIVVTLMASCRLFSDRVKAEMDLKELSETVQQQQQQQCQQSGGPVSHTTPKRPIRSLDKTIESCKAQLGRSFACLVLKENNQQCAKRQMCNKEYVCFHRNR